MVDINWKEGNVVVNSYPSEFINFDTFEIIFGENETPFIQHGLNNGCYFKLVYNFYIEYNIKVYGFNSKTKEFKLVTEKKFDCTDQNILIELEPMNQIELDIWLSYLENFAENKKCFLFLKLIKNQQLNICDSKFYKTVDNLENLDYYIRYKICWENNYNTNPNGINNLSSYELINNFLLKL